MLKTTLTILLIAFLQICVSAQDKRIENIREVYRKTNDLIAKAEKNFKESEIFVTEMIVNKGETSYPAIGIFRKEVKFYYTYGDRLENPYPNRILKIVAVTTRSAVSELDEYYFNAKGEFVFNRSKLVGGDTESRLCFDKGKIIRFLVGEDDITKMNFRRQGAIVQETLDKQKILVSIFKNSLEE